MYYIIQFTIIALLLFIAGIVYIACIPVFLWKLSLRQYARVAENILGRLDDVEAISFLIDSVTIFDSPKK